ncbi:MAG: hypothetical protein K2J11_07360 [Oscillospiraceae bacterium]|nr:hypothetical protein [Oscillospiraceae bacterium]
MDRNLFTAAEIVWIICALSPAVTAVLLKGKKLTKIKFFAMGMAAAFLTGAITLVLGIVVRQLIVVVLPLSFLLMCGIYFSGCLDDTEALALSLGMSQLFLAFQVLWAALSIDEIIHIDYSDVCACHYEIINYHGPVSFIAAALIRTAAAFLIAFAVKKIFASEKLSRTKTVALSAAVSAAGLAADVCIIIYFI